MDRALSLVDDKVSYDNEKREIVIVPHDQDGVEIRIKADEIFPAIQACIQKGQEYFNIIKDKVENHRLPDGSRFHWDTAINTNDPAQSVFNMSWTKTFKDDDVTITASVSGKPMVWASPAGVSSFNDFNLSANFSATKRF